MAISPNARLGGALALALLVAGGASAHVPDVQPGSRDLGATDRSWAFYDELAPGETHTWTFDAEEGSALFVAIGVPTGGRWTPQANLTGPTGPVALVQEDKVSLEPFAAYASVDVWRLDVPAPATGTYRLVVGGTGGQYVFGFGLEERFSIGQWVGVPWEMLRIYAWQGLPWWPTALLYLAAVAAVVLFNKPPPAALLPRLGAALFAASGADRILHLLFAAAAGAQASWLAWALAIGLAAPAAGLAWGAWRSRRAGTTAALAAGGLALWAGLYVGPAVMLAASIQRLVRRPTRSGNAPASDKVKGRDGQGPGGGA